MAIAFLGSFPRAWSADEDGSTESTVRKRHQEGLNFYVPPDWPVERRAGIVAPIPIEEYLANKFGALNERLDTVDRHISALEDRLKATEEVLRKQRPLGGS